MDALDSEREGVGLLLGALWLLLDFMALAQAPERIACLPRMCLPGQVGLYM